MARKPDSRVDGLGRFPNAGRGVGTNDLVYRKLCRAVRRLDADLRRPQPWMRSLLGSKTPAVQTSSASGDSPSRSSETSGGCS